MASTTKPTKTKMAKNQPTFGEFAGATAPAMPAPAMMVRNEMYLILLTVVGLIATLAIGAALLRAVDTTAGTAVAPAPGYATTLQGSPDVQQTGDTGQGSAVQLQSQPVPLMQPATSADSLQGGQR